MFGICSMGTEMNRSLSVKRVITAGREGKQNRSRGETHGWRGDLPFGAGCSIHSPRRCRYLAVRRHAIGGEAEKRQSRACEVRNARENFCCRSRGARHLCGPQKEGHRRRPAPPLIITLPSRAPPAGPTWKRTGQRWTPARPLTTRQGSRSEAAGRNGAARQTRIAQWSGPDPTGIAA